MIEGKPRARSTHLASITGKKFKQKNKRKSRDQKNVNINYNKRMFLIIQYVQIECLVHYMEDLIKSSPIAL